MHFLVWDGRSTRVSCDPARSLEKLISWPDLMTEQGSPAEGFYAQDVFGVAALRTPAL